MERQELCMGSPR